MLDIILKYYDQGRKQSMWKGENRLFYEVNWQGGKNSFLHSKVVILIQDGHIYKDKGGHDFVFLNMSKSIISLNNSHFDGNQYP